METYVSEKVKDRRQGKLGAFRQIPTRPEKKKKIAPSSQ